MTLRDQLAAILPADCADRLRVGSDPQARGPAPLPMALPMTPPAALRRFAAHRPGADIRAVASLWSGWYLLALLPGAVAAILVAGRDLPLDPAEVTTLVAADGRPVALCLPHGGCPGRGDPLVRLLPLRTQIEALATTLARTGLPAPVLWGNAAAMLRWTCTLLAERPQAGAAAALLRAPLWPDGQPNLLAAQLRPPGPDGVARRRVCCLRFRLAAHPACGDCPRGGCGAVCGTPNPCGTAAAERPLVAGS